MIKKAKHDYYTDTIISAGNNCKKLFKISNSLLGRITPRILPDCIPSINATNFDNYFNIKIHRIINCLPKPILPPLILPIYSLNSFYTPSTACIDKLLLAVKSSCTLAPIHTLLLHKLSSFLSPFCKSIIENSLLTGVVTHYMKLSLINPIIKNSSDKSDLSNYHLISNLSFISKTLERVIAAQLNNYLINNNKLNKFQNAYTNNKNMETALTHILNNILLYPTKYCSIIVFWTLQLHPIL